MDKQKRDLPPTPLTPEGYTFNSTDSPCSIQFVRTGGMGCWYVFLTVWLTGWTIGLGLLLYRYFNGGPITMGDDDPIPLRFVLSFAIPWVIVSYLFVYSVFARQSIVLGQNSLQMKTQLLLMSWSLSFPRDAIVRIRQVKDSREVEDSYSSWALQIESSAVAEPFLLQLLSLHHWRRNVRYRSVLARLPYEHSEWLGIVVARWADAELELCPKPGSRITHMTTTENRRPAKSARTRYIGKPAGLIQQRVQQVGPTYFGIVAVDCAKRRSKWMLCDFYGKVLIEPTSVEHTASELQLMTTQIKQASQEIGIKDLIAAVEMTGVYHRRAGCHCWLVQQWRLGAG